MPSPLEKNFVLHYRVHDLRSGPWTRERVHRLAALLGLTIPELGRMIRVIPCHFLRMTERGTFPGPVLLLLDLVERSSFAAKLGQEYSEPLFPHG